MQWLEFYTFWASAYFTSSLHFYLSINQSINLSIQPSTCLYISVSGPLKSLIRISLNLSSFTSSVSPSFNSETYLSIYLSLCISIYVICIYLSISIYKYLSIYLSIYPIILQLPRFSYIVMRPRDVWRGWAVGLAGQAEGVAGRLLVEGVQPAGRSTQHRSRRVSRGWLISVGIFGRWEC